MAPYNYTHLRPPAKSKSPFYTTSPHWTDITPIPLLEADPSQPDPGPALATIAYSPRYTEAMSYLRAVMAINEASERVLALTEDVIGMNPAHYTVWGFRMRSLRKLWGVGDGSGKVVVEEGLDKEEERERRVRDGVEKELEWLEEISERNLKNYQIWHHRQSLLSLLPLPTTPTQHHQTASFLHNTEIPFLTHILSFDAKNYHVWTYRQWLCRRYSSIILAPFPSPQDATVEQQRSSEVLEIEKLISEDVRNNSAWSHRYFCVFGSEELAVLESQQNLDPKTTNPLIRKDLFSQRNGGSRKNEDGNLLPVENNVRDREVDYAKTIIERTPQNPSPWNYLRGVLCRCDIPQAEFMDFCEKFVRGGGEADTTSSSTVRADEERELDYEADTVRSSHAIAWLAEIYAEEKPEEGKEKATRCWRALGSKWDPIRKNYWEWRIKGMEQGKRGVGLP